MKTLDFFCPVCNGITESEISALKLNLLENGRAAAQCVCSNCGKDTFRVLNADEKEEVIRIVEGAGFSVQTKPEAQTIAPKADVKKELFSEEFARLNKELRDYKYAASQDEKKTYESNKKADDWKTERMNELSLWRKEQDSELAAWRKMADFNAKEPYIHSLADIQELIDFCTESCTYIRHTMCIKKLNVSLNIERLDEAYYMKEVRSVLCRAEFKYQSFRNREMFYGANHYGFGENYGRMAREIAQWFNTCGHQVKQLEVRYNSRGEAKPLSYDQQEELNALLGKVAKASNDADVLCKHYFEETQNRYAQRQAIVDSQAKERIAAIIRAEVQKREEIESEHARMGREIAEEAAKKEREHGQKLAALSVRFREAYMRCGVYGAAWNGNPYASVAQGEALEDQDISSCNTVYALAHQILQNSGSWRHPGAVAAEVSAELVDQKHLEYCFSYPRMLPFERGFSLLCRYGTEAEKARSLEGIKALMLRLMAVNPPGRIRFTLADPIGQGANFGEFLPLMEKNAQLIDTKPWTNKKDIMEKLEDISGHIENVLTKQFVGRYQNIADFNRDNSAVMLDYRVLVLLDLQSALEEHSGILLKNILLNGPKCGVITVMLVKIGQELPKSLPRTELERLSGNLANALNETMPPVDVVSDIIGQTAKGAQTYNATSFDYIKMLGMAMPDLAGLPGFLEDETKAEGGIKLPEWVWASSSIDSLKVPIGLGENRKIAEFEIGVSTQHDMLLTGRQGSGKSNLLDVIILTSCLMYSPEELELYLVDMREGVEFNSYASTKLPHAKEIALTTRNREYAVYVLRRMVKEMERRGQLCKQAGSDVTTMKSYRLKTGKSMPRILGIFDEYQKLFDSNDSLSLEANRYIDDLARRGRGFGINLIFSTQTIRGTEGLSSSAKALFEIRVSFKTDAANAREIMGDYNTAPAELNSVGRAIYNQKAGELNSNQEVQVAKMDKSALVRVANLISSLAGLKGFTSTPTVFDDAGDENVSMRLQSCASLMMALEGYQDRKNKFLRAWIGRTLKSTEPLKVLFEAEMFQNMILLSVSEEKTLGVVMSIVAGIATSGYYRKTKIHIINALSPDSENNGYIEAVAEALNGRLEVVGKSVNQVTEFLSAISRILEMRRNPALQGLDKDECDHFIVFLSIQKLNAVIQSKPAQITLRQKNTPETPYEQLNTIFSGGPECGIFSLVCTNSYQTLGRVLEANDIQNFTKRAAGPMIMEESNKFLNTSSAAKLGSPDWMVFSDRNEPEDYPVFVPYQKPEAEWVKNILGGIEF